MTTEYTDTILLEANRLKSIEYTSGNIENSKSVYTNKFSPVQLNAGDEISLFSGYVSAVGCGGSVIEVLGERLNETVTINETKIKLTDEGNPDFKSSLLPYNAEKVELISTPISYDLKDNQIPIEFQFYKNTNGELHMHLPRKFDKGYIESSNDSEYQKNWSSQDSSLMGSCKPPVDFKRCSHDWMNIKYKAAVLEQIERRSSKNERYTIMANKSTVYSSNNASFNVSLADSLLGKGWKNPGTMGLSGLDTSRWVENLDPALQVSMDYDYYTQTKLIEVDIGFDAPSNIAKTITEQLKTSNNTSSIYGKVGTGGNSKEYDVSTKLESTLYKTFRAATPISFSKVNADYYFGGSEDTGYSTQSASDAAVAYISNYNFMGMKRPELYITGRKIIDMSSGNVQVDEDISKGGAGPDDTMIKTDIEYTESNCKVFGDFFEAQGLYPELFDYSFNKLVTKTTSRYIHINASNVVINPVKNVLGDDNYGTTEKASLPLFIHFDNNSSNTFYKPYFGSSDASFGCCIPYEVSKDNFFIAFETKQLGGIPANVFTGNTIKKDTLIGYDNHFNAYGTSNCLLYSGYLNRYFDSAASFTLEDWDESAKFINEFATEIYCGTRDPLFNFDDINNRFQISRLHSSEQVGNYYMSGSGQIPVVADASDECYKMNKRLNHFSYTPDMIPYPTPVIEAGVYFFQANQNLDRTIIYDSQSGVFIQKIAIPEKVWTKSLMGVLGFTYNQFYNQPLSSQTNNIARNQIRMNNLNLQGLSTPTTNNNVLSTDVNSFCLNVFNSIIYSPQLPLPQTYTAGVGLLDPSIFPTVVEESKSTIIEAVNLPTKQIAPYYLIRTNIISPTMDSNRDLLPIIATISKDTPSNDYFSSLRTETFTVTKPFTITDIKTEILNPEGKPTYCDERSSVIYSIKKNIVTDFNIGEEILQGKK